MIGFFPALLLLASAPTTSALAPDLEVTGAQFFAIDTRTEPPRIVESASIPHRPETSCFGWLIRIAPRQGEVTVREELRLPAPAPNWGTAEGTSVHPDRAGATSTFTDDLSDGMLTNEWCLSEGDPTGAHQISISVSGRLLHQFEFTVLAPPTSI